MNSRDIANALAARFTGITAGGDSIAVGPTALLPNTIAKGPALLVYPPTGELRLAMGPRRQDMLTFPVRLLLDPLDVPTRSAALYAWYDAMRDRVEANFDLDLAYVSWAQPVSMRAELDGEEYAGSSFDVVELMVDVRLDEPVPTVAV